MPVQVGASTLDIGDERCVCLTFADLTQLKRGQEALNLAHEKALQASRLKAEFVANMSHEIRTPLNGVIAMAGLLLETDLDGDQRQYARAMRTSGMALMSMVDEILDFSEVEAGGLQLEQAPFDLSAVIEEACTAVAAPDEGVELRRCDRRAGAGDRVRRRRSRVCQVLTHLMSNAVKFTVGRPDPGASDPRSARRASRASASRSATPASASMPPRWTGSSSPSPRPTAPPPARTAGRGSD